MKRRITLTFGLVLCLAVLVAPVVILQKSNQSQEREFKDKIIRKVHKCIDYNISINKKEEIFTLLDQLKKEGFVCEHGSDDLREKFVTVQGCVEHVLARLQAKRTIKDLVGIIHTPTPATPLCTLADPLDRSLLDPKIRDDLNKLFTVQSRAHIIRDFLAKGGKLHIVYPQGGLEKRSAEQQEIYRRELQNHKNSLFDTVLSTTKMDPDMVGATYFFRNQQNRIFVFSIKSKQANAPDSSSEWAIWLSPLNDQNVRSRVDALFSYLNTCNGPTRELFAL